METKQPKLIKVDSWGMSMYNPDGDVVFYYDETTKRHELRHRHQSQSTSWTFATMLAQYCIPLSIVSLASTNQALANLFMLYYFGLLAAKEIDAWLYAWGIINE